MPRRPTQDETERPDSAAPVRGANTPGGREGLGWLAALAVAGLAGVLMLWRPVNHDVAWYVYGAGRLIEGASLYRDVIDLNPPLIFYLSALPAGLARVGVDSLSAVKVSVLLLLLVSLFFSWRVLRRTGETSAGYLAPVLAYTGGLLIGDLFGQREHLAWLLFAPCLLAAGAAARGAALPRADGLAVGVLAGLGFALKPHFILIWLASEAVVLALCGRRAWRQRAAPAAAVAGVLLLYGLSVPLLTPEYLRAVAPLASEVYAAYDASPRYLMTHPALLPTLLAVGLALVLSPGLPAAQRGLPLVFVAASVAGLAAALLQRKGWDYHFFPAQAAAYAAVVLLVVRFVSLYANAAATVPAQAGSRRSAEGEAHAAAWSGARAGAGLYGVTVLVLATAAVLDVVRAADNRPLPQQLQTVLGAELKGQPFAVLSASVYPAFPLVNLSGAQWALRYNCLWPLPGWHPRGYPSGTTQAGTTQAGTSQSGVAQSGAAPAAPTAAERAFRAAVVEDLLRASPRVLLVDTGAHFMFGGGRFDYPAYFSQDERFAEWFRSYQRTSPPGQTYQVYRRRDAAVRPPAEAS